MEKDWKGTVYEEEELGMEKKRKEKNGESGISKGAAKGKGRRGLKGYYWDDAIELEEDCG